MKIDALDLAFIVKAYQLAADFQAPKEKAKAIVSAGKMDNFDARIFPFIPMLVTGNQINRRVICRQIANKRVQVSCNAVDAVELGINNRKHFHTPKMFSNSSIKLVRVCNTI
jgi:hypothetical protein